MKPPIHIWPEPIAPAPENPLGRARRPWRAGRTCAIFPGGLLPCVAPFCTKLHHLAPSPEYFRKPRLEDHFVLSSFCRLESGTMGQNQNFVDVPPLQPNHFRFAVPDSCPNRPSSRSFSRLFELGNSEPSGSLWKVSPEQRRALRTVLHRAGVRFLTTSPVKFTTNLTGPTETSPMFSGVLPGFRVHTPGGVPHPS